MPPPAASRPAPPLPADVDLARPRGSTTVRVTRENFEAIVVAFIMALVIRCFCIEVFKIPTASMEPTLLGDAPDRNRAGDRIMVNKFSYEFGPVERYDVVVFKFPLDLTRNFIKRVIGLPDEQFWLRGGDVYVQRPGEPAFTLARKPVRAQEGIWIPVYADGLKEPEFHKRWKPAAPAGGNWQVFDGALRTFTGDGRAPEAAFRFVPRAPAVVIEDFDDRAGNDQNRHAMSDLRLGARVEFLSAQGEFMLAETVDLPGDADQLFRVILSPGRKLVVEHPDPDANFRQHEWHLDTLIAAEREYEVALLVYDGAVAVMLDGKVVHDVVYRSALPAQDETFPATLSVTARRAEVAVRDLSVGRDIHYFLGNPPDAPTPGGHAEDRLLQNEPVLIPPECHLLVGDNVRNSHDGRVWLRVEVRFRDGSTTWWDNALFHEEEDRLVFLKKVEGHAHQTEVAWEVPRSQVAEVVRPRGPTARADGRLEVTPGPDWVERRHIVGKAFWIWWPADRAFRIIR